MTPRLPVPALVIVLSLPPGIVHGDVSEYSSYDECILESLKGVSSDVAANAIIASCRNKFPAGAPVATEQAASPLEEESVSQETTQAETEPESAPANASRDLTPEELSKLKATLFGLTTKYRVTFENFNENITVTEVTIAVWDELDPRGLKKYTETMHIPPQEMAKVTYEVVYMGDDQGWRWKIDSAKGVE
jgi:hypothetical protein